MKNWQFYLLTSFIFGAQVVSDWLATSIQAISAILTIVWFYLERKA